MNTGEIAEGRITPGEEGAFDFLKEALPDQAEAIDSLPIRSHGARVAEPRPIGMTTASDLEAFLAFKPSLQDRILEYFPELAAFLALEPSKQETVIEALRISELEPLHVSQLQTFMDTILGAEE